MHTLGQNLPEKPKTPLPDRPNLEGLQLAVGVESTSAATGIGQHCLS